MTTIVCFGAHPDDIEIGCGATLAKWKQTQHATIHHVILTSGEAGTLHTPADQLIATREAEARRAAAIIGASSVEFLRFEDGLTSYTKAMKESVIRCLRRLQPDVVFCHGSEDRFPDHRVVHQLVMDALAVSSGPWYPGCGDNPTQVKAIYGYEVWHPMNRFQMSVDVTEYFDTKMKALSAFESQVTEVAYDDAFRGLARYRGVMTLTGQYAEVFEVIRITG